MKMIVPFTGIFFICSLTGSLCTAGIAQSKPDTGEALVVDYRIDNMGYPCHFNR